MATTSPDLGYNTTIAFATSSFAASVRSISFTGQSREVVDASHLTTATSRHKLFGDLVDRGGLDLDVIWDTSQVPPISGAAEVVTITLPDTSTIIGQGAVTEYAGPQIGIDELQTASVHVEWNGLNSAGNATGPVFSAA